SWVHIGTEERAKLAPNDTCNVRFELKQGRKMLIQSQNKKSGNYKKGYQCKQAFKCKGKNGAIQFKCKTFDIERTKKCANDSLIISDNDGRLGKYCGKKSPDLTSRGNLLRILFTS
ncbi:unnamed protein product, partial [Meganyctiphanes norvegica]